MAAAAATLNSLLGATETRQLVINGAQTTREIFAGPWRRVRLGQVEVREEEGGKVDV